MHERMRTIVSLGSLGLSLVVLTACELEEITIAEVQDVVIAEIYLDVRSEPGGNIARAFLHRTVGVEGAELLPSLSSATVTMTRTDGYSFPLVPEAWEDCVESSPSEEPGACFVATAEAGAIRPGDVVEVLVELPERGEIRGATRVPGLFGLDGIPEICSLPADRLMTIAWSPSDGAWAYLNETSIRGLPDALRSEGITVEDDPLYLLGLSISDSDTNVVFPSQFGVFNRFALDVDVAIRLQVGLPVGTSAEVSITAVDRNYVNWARGGNFNPSGQVRIPSLSGDGTGVFGATFGLGFDVLVSNVPTGLPACPLG